MAQDAAPSVLDVLFPQKQLAECVRAAAETLARGCLLLRGQHKELMGGAQEFLGFDVGGVDESAMAMVQACAGFFETSERLLAEAETSEVALACNQVLEECSRLTELVRQKDLAHQEWQHYEQQIAGLLACADPNSQQLARYREKLLEAKQLAEAKLEVAERDIRGFLERRTVHARATLHRLLHLQLRLFADLGQAASAVASSFRNEFRPGTTVEILGLQKDVELNGLLGTIGERDRESDIPGRMIVHLADGSRCIRSEHLRPVEPRAPEAETCLQPVQPVQPPLPQVGQLQLETDAASRREATAASVGKLQETQQRKHLELLATAAFRGWAWHCNQAAASRAADAAAQAAAAAAAEAVNTAKEAAAAEVKAAVQAVERAKAAQMERPPQEPGPGAAVNMQAYHHVLEVLGRLGVRSTDAALMAATVSAWALAIRRPEEDRLPHLELEPQEGPCEGCEAHVTTTGLQGAICEVLLGGKPAEVLEVLPRGRARVRLPPAGTTQGPLRVEARTQRWRLCVAVADDAFKYQKTLAFGAHGLNVELADGCACRSNGLTKALALTAEPLKELDRLELTDNRCFYFEFEVVGVSEKRTSRTLALGFAWDADRLPDTAAEMPRSIVVGGDLPRAHFNGREFGKVSGWRPLVDVGAGSILGALLEVGSCSLTANIFQDGRRRCSVEVPLPDEARWLQEAPFGVIDVCGSVTRVTLRSGILQGLPMLLSTSSPPVTDSEELKEDERELRRRGSF